MLMPYHCPFWLVGLADQIRLDLAEGRPQNAESRLEFLFRFWSSSEGQNAAGVHPVVYNAWVQVQVAREAQDLPALESALRALGSTASAHAGAA